MSISEETVSGVAAASGAGGVLAAASCCVLPLALAGVGVGASALARFDWLHVPLSAMALLAVITGWLLYGRRKRSCAQGEQCAPPSPIAFTLLLLATALVAVSASWRLIEAPLMRMVGP